jgi:mRNA interferase MazF
VILQSDDVPLSTTLVAPTSTAARAASFRPEIEIEGTRTRVLVEQLAAVDLSRLGDRVGRVGPEDWASVESALVQVLDL